LEREEKKARRQDENRDPASLLPSSPSPVPFQKNYHPLLPLSPPCSSKNNKN
jgi:hypothetical protein